MNNNRGLLLDRDGVINVDRGFVGTIDQFEFMPGIFPFLRSAQDRGYRLAVVTNQSGVARGLYTAQDHGLLTAHIQRACAKEQINLELTFACFEHPDGSMSAYKRESFWSKPNPGMVLEAIRKMRLDPARSVLLGDRLRDLEAARSAGIAHCLWLADATEKPPDFVKIVRNFDEALDAFV